MSLLPEGSKVIFVGGVGKKMLQHMAVSEGPELCCGRSFVLTEDGMIFCHQRTLLPKNNGEG